MYINIKTLVSFPTSYNTCSNYDATSNIQFTMNRSPAKIAKCFIGKSQDEVPLQKV